MQTPCYVTQDTARYYAKAESDEQRREELLEHLEAEYMAAACVPLIASVSTPTDRQSGRRAPFLEMFTDKLSEDRAKAARVVAILMRDAEGKKLVEEMAAEHAAWFIDDAMVSA